MLDDVLLHCQNSSTLESAHGLLQTLSSNPKFSHALEHTGILGELLEDMGFGGLWRSCSFSVSQEQDKQCFGLTEKLIEVSTPCNRCPGRPPQGATQRGDGWMLTGAQLIII